MNKKLEIVPVEKERSFLSQHLKQYYEKISRYDEFSGIKLTYIDICVYEGTKSSNSYDRRYEYENTLNLSLDIINKNGVISYEFSGYGHARQNLLYAATAGDIAEHFARIADRMDSGGHETLGGILLLTKEGNRFNLKDLKIPEESLSEILSNTTKFRATIVNRKEDDNNNVISEEPEFDYDDYFKFPFPCPYDVIRYIATDGNLPDEEIDELYDNIQASIAQEAERKKVEAEKEEIKKKVQEKEAAIQKKLDSCEYDILSAILTNPSEIEEVATLQSYCKENDTFSSLLYKIESIPDKYNTKEILDSIYNMLSKENRYKKYARWMLYTWIIAFIIVWYQDTGTVNTIGWIVIILAIILRYYFKDEVKKLRVSEEAAQFLKDFCNINNEKS